MVLSDWVIKKELALGNIVIEGFKEENLGPNSYDMTLAPNGKMYLTTDLDNEWCLDVRKNNPTKEFTMPEEGFVLRPNHLYLYSCNEKLGVHRDICATVMGKSSLGRLGLDVHVCAGFVDAGFGGSLVLEMRCIYPLRIYPDMKICQIKFERTEGIAERQYGHKELGSKYQGQEGVVASKYHKNF